MAKYNIRKSYVYHDYYSRLKNIALSAFKWEGLPETCNERFLEDTLFHYGQAIFVDDPNLGFLNLKCTQGDTLNVYNEPTAYIAYGTNYDNKTFRASECVLVRNNYLSKSTESTIVMYAEKLAAIDLTIDVNIHAQKTPILIRCDEKSRHSLDALYNQYSGDKPFIFGSKSLQEKPLEVLVTGAPFVADKLREEKRAVWNEALEFLGLNTNPSDKKKERLITNEVDANNEQIDIQCETMLLVRQEACKQLKKLFGLNVTVEKRVGQKEVSENGELHNGTARSAKST